MYKCPNCDIEMKLENTPDGDTVLCGICSYGWLAENQGIHRRQPTNEELLGMLDGMLLSNKDGDNWLTDMLNEFKLIILENDMLDSLTDEKSNLIEIMENELTIYKSALEQIADHKNTLYAAIANKALEEVNK